MLGFLNGIASANQRSASEIPTQIGGLQLWLDASDQASITQAGGAVIQWDDKSGHGFHATQATGADQPLTNSDTLNGLNVIQYANDFLNIPPTSYKTLIFAVKSLNMLGISPIVGGSGSFDNEYVFVNSNKLDADYDISVDGSAGKIANVYFGEGRSGYGDNINLGNTNAQNESAAIWAVDYTTTNHADYIGAFGQGGTTKLSGKIAEMMFYDRRLSPQEFNLIGQYLADKWSLTWTHI
ncbi:MAG: hypothetical protein GW778_07015 [Alphaproteobacteria bacterium]|nr:hypothetical protein [Alphaproteobacteria bacterium]